MMDITEGMFRHVANKVCGTGKITFDGVDLDLDKPFERISMVEAVRKYAGVDFDQIETLEEARAVAKEHHIEYEQRHKKATFSICLSRLTSRINSSSPRSLPDTPWKSARLQSAIPIIPATPSVLSCS